MPTFWGFLIGIPESCWFTFGYMFSRPTKRLLHLESFLMVLAGTMFAEARIEKAKGVEEEVRVVPARLRTKIQACQNQIKAPGRAGN